MVRARFPVGSVIADQEEEIDAVDAEYKDVTDSPPSEGFDLARFKSLYEPQALTIADFWAELGISAGATRAAVQTAADGWALAHPNTDPELALVTRILELRAPEPAMELED